MSARPALAVAAAALAAAPLASLAGSSAPALALCLGAAALAGGEFAAQRGDDSAVGSDPLCLLSALALLALLLAAAATIGGAAATRAQVALDAATVAAFVVMLGGAGLRVAAVRSLGARFVSHVRASERAALYQRGLYAVLRHPSETGLLLFGAGAATLAGGVVAPALAAAVVLPLTLLRVRREETQLRRVFGARYDDYAARVGGLIPRWPRRRRRPAPRPAR